MEKVYIVAAGRQVNGVGSLADSYRIEKTIFSQGFDPVELVIDPLRAGWDTPVADKHFRSGCAPIEALSRAQELIVSGNAPAVVISGEDPLKTGYGRAERHKLMAIYGPKYPITEAYTDLSRVFMAKHGITEDEFKQLAKQLFENYVRTIRRNGHYDLPEPSWYQLITGLFRGVDCANPMIDFAGRVVLCNRAVADACSIPAEDRVSVLGVGLGSLTEDGPKNISNIAAYRHLEKAFRSACEQADTDFAKHFLAGEALLEAYTCYPVVPLAFLLASGIASSLKEIPVLLQRLEITVTGGMNLARAPWNNPALNAMVTMYKRLRHGSHRLGAVHGNGGLGYRQGVAILGRPA